MKKQSHSDPHELAPRKVLIANHQFRRYSGSELHAIQLAEFFMNEGAEVDFFGLSTEPWLLEEIEAKGVKFLSWRQVLQRSKQHYDIVWTHSETQFFLLHTLLGMRCKLAVHGILSYFVRLERVPLLSQRPHSDKLFFLANSVETREKILETSRNLEIRVLRNIVPDAFSAHAKLDYSQDLRRVAVVSNHVPVELIDAKRLLADKGIEVDVFGVNHQYVLVDHHTLTSYDVVITIGKTAQYAIVQGIPLFLYDIFGGPGYLTQEDFTKHEDFNFSGRSDPTKLSAEDICATLIGQYSEAVSKAQAIREASGDRYSVAAQTHRTLAALGHEYSSAFDRKGRLLNTILTMLMRPSVPLRVVFPKTVENFGTWLNIVRKSVTWPARKSPNS